MTEEPGRPEGPGPPPAEPPPAQPPPAEPLPPAEGLPPPPPPPIAAEGWTAALVRGLLAFVVVLLVAEILGTVSAIDSDLSAVNVAKLGAFLFFGFHHVGIRADVRDLDLSGILGGAGTGDLAGELPFDLFGSVSVSMTISFAMLAGTALALWLVYRGGRAAAEAGGGPLWGRAAVGAFVAVPYAALSLILALVLEVRFAVPFVGAPLTVAPTPLAAVLWPLLLGGVAGALGGLSSARDEIRAGRRGPLALAAGGGGVRMLAYALGISFLGLLVLAGANPEVTREYFAAVAEAGPLDGSVLVLYTTILIAPLMMVAGLFGGMGASIVVGEYAGTNTVTVLSLWAFPEGLPEGLPGVGGVDPLQAAALGPFGEVPFETGVAPPEYFVFVLAPLVAVVAGGWWAARRAGAVTSGEGAAAGAAAGGVFALGVIALSLLGAIGFRTDIQFGLSQSVVGRLGPHLLLGSLLAVLWGVAGGALGGLFGRGRAAPPL